jgi:hypothetical protein
VEPFACGIDRVSMFCVDDCMLEALLYQLQDLPVTLPPSVKCKFSMADQAAAFRTWLAKVVDRKAKSPLSKQEARVVGLMQESLVPGRLIYADVCAVVAAKLAQCPHCNSEPDRGPPEDGGVWL